MVKAVTANVQGSSKELTYTEEQGGYQLRLEPELFPNDGQYTLTVTAESSIITIDPDAPITASKQLNLQVLRSSPGISMLSPENFAEYISGAELSASFQTHGLVEVKELECWIRDNYSSDTAPTDKDKPYVKVDDKLSCTLNNLTDMENPAFIIKATGENGLSQVSIYPFKRVDTIPPTYNGGDVTLPLSALYVDNNIKKVFFSPEFNDITGLSEEHKPSLKNNTSGKIIEPSSECTSLDAQKWKCTYRISYADLFDGDAPEKALTIQNLVDRAGNKADDIIFTVKKPNNVIGLTLINPAQGSSSNSANLNMELSHITQTLESLEVRFGDQTYGKDQFDSSFYCSIDKDKLCRKASFPLTSAQRNTELEIVVKATNLWGISEKIERKFITDNTPSTIDDQVTVASTPGTDSKSWRFKFAVSDTGSGVQKVIYKFLDKTIEKTTDTEPNAFSYLDINSDSLKDIETLRFEVTAFDKGFANQASKNIDVDLSASKLTLSFGEFVTQTDSGLLLLKNKDQYFKVEQSTGVEVKDFSLVFIQEQQEKMTFTGEPLKT